LFFQVGYYVNTRKMRACYLHAWSSVIAKVWKWSRGKDGHTLAPVANGISAPVSDIAAGRISTAVLPGELPGEEVAKYTVALTSGILSD
jgi:hypothetical protein